MWRERRNFWSQKNRLRCAWFFHIHYHTLVYKSAIRETDKNKKKWLFKLLQRRIWPTKTHNFEFHTFSVIQKTLIPRSYPTYWTRPTQGRSRSRDRRDRRYGAPLVISSPLLALLSVANGAQRNARSRALISRRSFDSKWLEPGYWFDIACYVTRASPTYCYR